ncbi:hypothetical protein ACJJTC_018685, partial [Scirpophaga incertulas]
RRRRASSPEFVRNQYYGLEWRRAGPGGDEQPLGAGALVCDTDLYCRLRLARAGCFHYYFVYETAESTLGPQGSGWLQVAPSLHLPLDAVCCQTVLAKCLGPLPRWPAALRAAAEAGYNMLHFTPVQELGASRSSYSIADQLRLNPAFGGSLADLEHVLATLRADWKMLSICDVVLNHTANESAWLAEHPEAAYNCLNCPHLRPAAALDASLARLSAAVARGDLDAQGIPKRVCEPQHLEAIQRVLETQLVPALRLHEMFTCDVDRVVQEFYCLARNKVPAVKAAAAEGDELKLQPDPQYRRLHAAVDMERALQLYNVYRPECYDEDSRLKRCCEELRQRLLQLNAAAEDAVRAHLQAASDGPRIQEVSEKESPGAEGELFRDQILEQMYFAWVGAAPPDAEAGAGAGAEAEAEAALYDARGAHCMAHNGWVMAADPLQDFAATGSVYLRRELIAWGDSVKLRYGDAPAACPPLWARMRDYVELTAELFDGLRLDNCHSTPLHVSTPPRPTPPSSSLCVNLAHRTHRTKV